METQRPTWHHRWRRDPPVRHLGQCGACRAPVIGSEGHVWIRGIVFHAECTPAVQTGDSAFVLHQPDVAGATTRGAGVHRAGAGRA